MLLVNSQYYISDNKETSWANDITTLFFTLIIRDICEAIILKLIILISMFQEDGGHLSPRD